MKRKSSDNVRSADNQQERLVAISIVIPAFAGIYLASSETIRQKPLKKVKI